MNDMIEIGKIVNVHGLKGEVKIVPWLDFPEMFEVFDTVWTDEGKNELNVRSVKYQKSNIIAGFEEVNDANGAQILKNKTLYVPREYFDDLPDGTYLIADIIGLKVVDDTTEYGVITDVIQTGANDVYVFTKLGAADLLVPKIPDCVKEIDLEKGTVLVHLLPGLRD